jgi:hypothetical protein
MENRESGNLTSVQIIDLLQNDFEFAVNFIIDNNPSAVESNISSLSIPLPQNPSNLQIREVIDTLLQDGTNDKAVSQFQEILTVPYLDNAPNYTGGFGNYLSSNMPPAPNNASVGASVMGAISGIIQVAGNIWSGYKQEDIMEIQQEMQEAQIQFELDKIEKTKILGIPQTVFIAVIVFVMFTVLIVFLSNRR